MHNLDQSSTVTDVSDEVAPDTPTPPTGLILEAIARQVCVKAVYNRTILLLAPHILYQRHGALFVDALTIERDGKPPKESKLGAFKLDGLSGIATTLRRFSAFQNFKVQDPKYAEATLFAIGG